MSGKKKAPAMSRGESMQTLRKVLRVIGRYKALLIFSVLLAAATVVLQLYVPILFGDAIDLILGPGRVDFGGIAGILARVLTLVLISAATGWLMNLINNHLAFRTVRDIRARAIRRLQVLPLAYLDRHSAGDTVQRVIADTDQLSDGLLLGFTQLFSGVVTIGVTLGFMLSKNIAITLMVLLLTPVSFLVARFISSRSYAMFSKQTQTRGRQTALINEMIGNEKIVKAFGHEQAASEQFRALNEELTHYSQRAVFFS